jgi:hypothetical protein
MDAVVLSTCKNRQGRYIILAIEACIDRSHDMSSWTKVVVYPLGLAGFSIFMLYLFSKKTSVPLWLIALTTLSALAGGIFLAYVDRSRSNSSPSERPASDPVRKPLVQTPAQPSEIQQSSSGANSPNLSNVQGSVSFDYSTRGDDPHREEK